MRRFELDRAGFQRRERVKSELFSTASSRRFEAYFSDVQNYCTFKSKENSNICLLRKKNTKEVTINKINKQGWLGLGKINTDYERNNISGQIGKCSEDVLGGSLLYKELIHGILSFLGLE